LYRCVRAPRSPAPHTPPVMEQHRNRQPAGTPTGGQFAQETRGPSGIATLSGPGDGIHAVARDGGYPVVGQALLEANEQGLVSSEQLDALSWEQVTVMGDLDYQGAVA